MRCVTTSRHHRIVPAPRTGFELKRASGESMDRAFDRIGARSPNWPGHSPIGTRIVRRTVWAISESETGAGLVSSRTPIKRGENEVADTGGQSEHGLLIESIERNKWRELAAEQSVLAEIGRIISSSRDISAVFRKCTEQIKHLIDFDRLAIVVFDEDTGTKSDVYVSGVPDPQRKHGAVVPVADSITDEVSQHRKPMIFDEKDLRPRAGRYAGTHQRLELELRSLLAAPLVWEDAPIGMLNFRSKRKSAYGPREIEIAERIASQIAAVIASAELHARTLQLASEREARIKLDVENRVHMETERERDRFISEISHELRTPLTAIMAFADLLSRNKGGNLSDREIQQIGLIRKSSEHLDILINDLFDVSMINAGTFKLTLEDFDVCPVVQELCERLAPTFLDRGQDLEVNLPDDEVWVKADWSRITQVLTNLLNNAAKYSPKGGRVEIRVSLHGAELRICVKDDGIGISKDDQRRLFTPFFRANNAQTRNVPGTGLGLAVTKSIVESHGGSISLDSAPGEGTCFEVRLPNAKDRPSEAHLNFLAET